MPTSSRKVFNFPTLISSTLLIGLGGFSIWQHLDHQDALKKIEHRHQEEIAAAAQATLQHRAIQTIELERCIKPGIPKQEPTSMPKALPPRISFSINLDSMGKLEAHIVEADGELQPSQARCMETQIANMSNAGISRLKEAVRIDLETD